MSTANTLLLSRKKSDPCTLHTKVVAVGVGVSVSVDVAEGVNVLVGGAVLVAVPVLVGVYVGVGVSTGVLVGVPVLVGVNVGVGVLALDVDVAPPPPPPPPPPLTNVTGGSAAVRGMIAYTYNGMGSRTKAVKTGIFNTWG